MMKDLLIQQGVYKALLGKAQNSQIMDDDERKEMDAKVVSAIHLNLLDEFIHNVIDEENVKTI